MLRVANAGLLFFCEAPTHVEEPQRQNPLAPTEIEETENKAIAHPIKLNALLL